MQSISEKKRQTLLSMRQKADEFYNIGFDGNALKTFPNLTLETSAEEERHMIDCWIEKYCEESGRNVSEIEKEAMRLFDEFCIESYRVGLSERNRRRDSNDFGGT
jgi:tRNA U54 and U55 pseudouridine synthase Pus10